MVRKIAALGLALFASSALAQSSAQIEANKGVLKLAPTTDLPSPCRQGQLWFDTTTTTPKVCSDGTTWSSIGTSTLTPGTTTITGGTNTRVLFDDNGVLGEDAGFTYVKATDTATLGTLVVGAGTISAPSVAVGATNQGWYNRAATRLTAASGSAATWEVDSSGTFTSSSGAHFFLSGALGTGSDLGYARYAAGVLKITNGSTGIGVLLGGGANVASATAMPVPTGNVFHVTGTTNITSITSTNFIAGTVITLIFDGILTFTDGNNLKLAGNFVTTADDTITLVYDGTNWYEVARAVN